MLGTCKATEVSKEATTTLYSAGDREALGKRTDLLRSTTCTTTPDYEGEKLQAAAGLRVCCARAAAGGGGRAQRAATKRAASTPPVGAATNNERVRLCRVSVNCNKFNKYKSHSRIY